MPFNPISAVAKCVVEQSYRGEQCINSMYFLHAGGAITINDANGLAAALLSWWSLALMPKLSNDLDLLSVKVRDLTSVSGIEVFVGASGINGGAGDGMPNNVAACLSVRTPFAGRHYRGRIYLGGVPRSEVVENSLTASFQDEVATAFNTIVGPGGLWSNWSWAVVAQQNAGAVIPGGIVTEVTSALFVDPIVDSQRRRLPGRGK